MNKLLELAPNPVQYEGVCVSCTRNTEAPRQVDKPVPIGVPHIRAEGTLPDYGVLLRTRTLGSTVAASCDRRTLVFGKEIDPLLPLGAGDRSQKLGERRPFLWAGAGFKGGEGGLHRPTYSFFGGSEPSVTYRPGHADKCSSTALEVLSHRQQRTR